MWQSGTLPDWRDEVRRPPTLPAEVGEELGIRGEAQFQVEVIPDGLVLREAITVPNK